jgi:phosphate starvation-inducible PhoH-like protein/PhoH-like ATPase
MEQKLTKKQRRLLREQGLLDKKEHRPSYNLIDVKPLTPNQKKTFDSFINGKNLLLHGLAGTGKSFITLYLSLLKLQSQTTKMNKVTIMRSVVPTRDIGFMPGNAKEKVKMYEAPYEQIVNQLTGRHDGYNLLKMQNVIDFTTTSFIRGITISDAIVFVDEINNMTFHELDSIITRIGDNCQIVFCGDMRQSDLTREGEKQGLRNFMRVLKRLESFDDVEFEIDDIVRSGLVREYIIAKEALGL